MIDDDVAILDQERFHTDKIFRNMALLSARDAALAEASPIQIPGVRFEKTQTLTIDLDPKAVLRLKVSGLPSAERFDGSYQPLPTT